MNVGHLHAQHGPEAPPGDLKHHKEGVRAVRSEAQRPKETQYGVDDDHKVVKALHLLEEQFLPQKRLLAVELQQLVVHDHVPPASVQSGQNVQRDVPAHILHTEWALRWERAQYHHSNVEEVSQSVEGVRPHPRHLHHIPRLHAYTTRT